MANINIANITGIPPNINIQNLTGLPGMNIANLQGLQNMQVLYDFLVTVKVAPHECVIRTGQP